MIFRRMGVVINYQNAKTITLEAYALNRVLDLKVLFLSGIAGNNYTISLEIPNVKHLTEKRRYSY